jgi:hypothetical protein
MTPNSETPPTSSTKAAQTAPTFWSSPALIDEVTRRMTHARPVSTDMDGRGAALVFKALIPDGVNCPPHPGGVMLVQAELDRYSYLLAEGLCTVQLTVAEALLLIDTTNGWASMGADAGQQLWMELEERVAAGETRELNEEQARRLVSSVRRFTPLQALAVSDACGRYWNQPDDLSPVARLQAVGLV